MTKNCCTKCQSAGSNIICIPKGCKQGPRGPTGEKGPAGNSGPAGAPKMQWKCGQIHGQGSVIAFCDIIGTDYVPTEDYLLNLDPTNSVLYFYNAGTWEVVDVDNPAETSPLIEFIPLDGATNYFFLDVCDASTGLFHVFTNECVVQDLCDLCNNGDMFYDSVTGTVYKLTKSEECEWVVCGIFDCVEQAEETSPPVGPILIPIPLSLP